MDRIEELVKILKKHRAKFVVIGAAAFPVYGYARATLDFDIFIEPTEDNARRTLRALKEFGYDVVDYVKITDFLSKKTLIRQYIIETDIHPFVRGIEFKNIWKHKILAKIGGTYVYFPSLEDMIKMKRAAGRAKDREDIKNLLKLKEL